MNFNYVKGVASAAPFVIYVLSMSRTAGAVRLYLPTGRTHKNKGDFFAVSDGFGRAQPIGSYLKLLEHRSIGKSDCIAVKVDCSVVFKACKRAVSGKIPG